MDRSHPASKSGFRRYAGMQVDDVLQDLGSRREGLDPAEAASRFARSGPNEIGKEKTPSVFVLVLRQFRDPLVGILLFAAAVSLVARDFTDATVVLGIVLLSGLLSFVQEWRATAAVAALKARIAPRTTVRRAGASVVLPSREVVPGDVVELDAGSLVPADAILIEARDFLVSEAVLTGETFPAEKRPGVFAQDDALARCTPVIFAGTSVQSGWARAVVVETGRGTEFGAIAERLEQRESDTDFERGVRHFGLMVSQVMFVLVGIVFVLDVVDDKPPLDALLFAIAIAVGMAPELLPAVITITLSKGARDMAERGVIVRRLAAIENLGSMDVLCTDKTGTLTEGVVKLDGVADPEGADAVRPRVLAYLNASLQSGFRNPLDAAIVASTESLATAVPAHAKIDEIPYDFIRKRLGIVVDLEGVRTLVVKGALARVLEVCGSVRRGEGAAPLDEDSRAALARRADEYAMQGFRVLGVATREVGAKPAYAKADEAELVFEGFLRFADPPKPGVGDTLAALEKLGVSLKVITGDSREAALHLAQTIGLPVEGVLTARELADVSDDALTHLAERTTIFAEVDPNQKERLILALWRTGHCVGYMGDGINDAPALYAADVGISVEGAVDVAKDSADLVLLRRDLDVLRAGIVEGRRTFANTMKYVFTTTSANFGNMLSVAGASTFLPFLPLLAKQVLLNNFLSDIPAMTIATDGVDEEQVNRPPRWDVASIRRFMIVFGVISSTFDFLTFAYLRHLLRLAPEGFRTGWFVESLLTELVIVFVVRTHRPILRSRPSTPLLLSTLAVVLVALATPYVPFGSVFGFVPLPLPVMVTLVGLTLAYALVSELAKGRFFRREEARITARASRLSRMARG